ncbi:MAG: hypothetical protein M3Y58_21175 [Chloroflexota bacterium]|nr:hypothetical protein [Chloroflexota bacterium]
MTRRNRRGISPILLIAIMLTACGTSTPTSTPTTAPTPTMPASSTPPPIMSATPTALSPGSATPAVTAVPGTPSSAPLVASRTVLPTRVPEMTTGARSDGWVLDRIEASESGGRVSLTLRFEPLPGQAGGPQADAWFEQDDSTYTIAVRGVRGSNLVLPPSTMIPLAILPLRGYYALPVRDDTIFALVVVAARPSTMWSLTASDGPGILRLTLTG